VTRKEQILKAVSEALDNTDYGRVIIELRGPSRPMDLVIENRTRYTPPEPKTPYKKG
jgi:hypothetical protein